VPDSPLQRTLKLLRDSGWTVGITEHFNPHVRIRQDFCGFADAIAFRVGFTTLAVNAMHLKHRHEHDKLRENKALREWIRSGNRFALYQWRKAGDRGRRKLWSVIVREWKLDDMRIKRGQSRGEPLGKRSGHKAPAARRRAGDGKARPNERRRTHARSAGSPRTDTRRGRGQAHKLGDANVQ
jgi:hypothetical protein